MSARSRFLAAIAAGSVLIASLAAGCSDEADGDGFDFPGDGGQSTSAKPSDELEIPKVASPLRADPYLTKPCDLVDEKVLAEIGEMEPPESDVDSERAKRLTGPRCQWDGKDGNLDVSVAIQTPTNKASQAKFKGIAGIYYGHKNGLTDYLEPVDVPGHPGYPAVFAGSNEDKEFGSCPLFVGISDELTIATRVTDNSESPQNRCPATLKVAASVLQTLKKWG